MLEAAADRSGSFDRLVTEVTPPLLRFLVRQCGSQELAEDLAQETWLRVWRSRHAYVAGAKFRTWLYRIAVNTHLNRLRSESYRHAASLDAETVDGGGPLSATIEDVAWPAPSARLEAAELAARVRRAVDALPPTQRAAVLLFRFEGLSYEDIAATLDLSLQAVKSLLNRAKSRLHVLLADEATTTDPARSEHGDRR